MPWFPVRRGPIALVVSCVVAVSAVVLAVVAARAGHPVRGLVLAFGAVLAVVIGGFSATVRR